ncbi:MAG: LLM class flavin-dependent oxidoreductase [SAR324 cluster bacterium]|nr:LLM class flavin-dependent oxidoreductase [SAR324 cluster bacterium]
MKIGLVVNSQHHLEKDLVQALQEQYALVRLARDGGWNTVITNMHYLNEGENRHLQIIPLTARLQAEVGEMTLGMGILLINLHNPVYVAETVATLDVICRGNFIFGVGLGYRDVEFDAFRVPRGQRVRRFEECLALVKRLWTEDSVTHESEVCKLDGVRMNIRPVQRPYPPIWIAANHDNAVRRAARLGDTWYVNPHATLQTNRRQLDLYREERARLGLPFPTELPCRREIFCGKDRATALELAGPYISEKYRLYAQWGQDKAMPSGESLSLPFEELLRDRFILGSPEECYEQLRPYWEELGVNHFIFRTHFLGMPVSSAISSMRLISEELLPELRKL